MLARISTMRHRCITSKMRRHLRCVMALVLLQLLIGGHGGSVQSSAAAAAASAAAAAAGGGGRTLASTRTAPPIRSRSTCGTTSKFVKVVCLLDSFNGTYGLILTRADGTTSNVCSTQAGSLPDLKRRTFNIPDDDGIYGIRVCYRTDEPRAQPYVQFSTLSQIIDCGNRFTGAGLACTASQSYQQAPLAEVTASCASATGTINTITGACWNSLYVSPFLPAGGCPAGQGIVVPGLPCSNCPIGFFNPGGLVHCAKCPSRTTTTQVGASGCGCAPGTGTKSSTSRTCSTCSSGTYSPGGNLAACHKCPGLFLTSVPGSTHVADCICKAGYGSTVDQPNSCQICPKGSYSTGLAALQQAAAVAAMSSGSVHKDAAADEAAAPASSSAAMVTASSNALVPTAGLAAASVPPTRAAVDAAVQAVFLTGKGGKGKGRPTYGSPTYLQCVSCCDPNLAATACQLTTPQPGATSYSNCTAVE